MSMEAKTKRELIKHLLNLALEELELKYITTTEEIEDFIEGKLEKYQDGITFVNEEYVTDYFENTSYTKVNLPSDAHEFFNYQAYANKLRENELASGTLVRETVLGETWYVFYI